MGLSTKTQKKLWHIIPTRSESEQLAQSLNISPLVAQVLINRDICDAQQASLFLDPKLASLIKPEEMPGVPAAVERIAKAIKNNEKITIYGDYDVDGITSVSILLHLLKLLEANADFYIPHRIDEGYGLNLDAVKSLAQSGTQLLITVDCGIGAIEAAKQLKELGVDLIVTDHHQLGGQLPEAAAIVHTALDPDYPNQFSCGAMVAYKIAWALANEFNPGQRLDPPLRNFMINATTLAAMGTIADVMDLRGENRILVSYGLKALPQCQLSGIQALIDSTNLTGQGLDSFHVGYRLAPMLNAAGRMGHARLAVELITSENHMRSMQIADYLKQQNDLRRSCEKKMLKQAYELITQLGFNHPDRKSIVLANDNWHVGVVGIVASRIVDKYYKPTIMINTSNGIAHGSARSVKGFNILAAINSFSKYLISAGGHKMAAGVTLKTEKVPDFVDAIEEYAQQHLTNDDNIDKLTIDAQAKLEQFTEKTVRELENLGPFGQGNPEPIFATKGVRLYSPPRKVGSKNDHLQVAIKDNTSSLKCIGFGMGKYEKKLLENEFFNVAYQPQINTYNSLSSVQLVLTDIQFE
ncbi:MAG: single-stranded-DNA-specific exonuclease RecJ [Planctomycetes bacterium]|nr:single-stranded-DNA-specific exonuclease RecJ [Planctomycetota bacterium]